MKKVLCILLACMMLTLPGCGDKSNVNVENKAVNDKEIADEVVEEDTRYKWLMRKDIEFGMNYDEVLKQQGDVFIVKIDNGFGFSHKEKYRNCDVSELYLFEEDSLYQTIYWFKNCEITDGGTGYFGLYTELKTMLKEHYGEPAMLDEKWVNEEYKGKKEIHNAIKDGDYTSLAVWERDDFYGAITMDASKQEGISVMYYKKQEQQAKANESKKMTLGQKNALNKANSYLSIMGFSYSGLIKQLEYEGFTKEDATYAAENCGANWNEQAAKKAQSYIETMAFSRSGLIEQLVYEGFTREQAEYGVTAIGY